MPALTEAEVRNVLTGADGRLYFSPSKKFIPAADGTRNFDKQFEATAPANFLGHVMGFAMSTQFGNMDFHPLGSRVIYPIPVTMQFSLTLQETVIADLDTKVDGLLDTIKKYIENDCPVYFNFVGLIDSPCAFKDDGTVADRTVYEWMSLVNCVPDGSVDLLNIRPGDFITRAWTFRAASRPVFQKRIVGA